MKFLSSRRSILIILLVIFSSVALGSWAKSKYEKENVLADLDVFAKVVEKINSYYVDDVDMHALVTGAIQDMLQELDPHSQFLAGLDYDDLMMSTQGQFGGLGIYISYRDNFPTVISPIEGTPASRAGIQGGDRIVEIEGESAEGWHTQQAVRYLRGDPGSPVSFKIARPGMEDTIEYTLVREKIEVSSVTYAGVNDGVGYVKLANFSKNTRDELIAALDQLEAEGAEALVLDLRWNPGGLLQAATSVSELFLDRDKLVVYTKGRFSQNNHKYYANKSHKFEDRPVIVMINGASASASEIVAGAIQDWDAGFVVGQTSFGKGTVQTVYALTDSQAVKLTTAKYYTPSGRSIHKDHRAEDAADAEEADGDLSMTEAPGGLEMGDPDRPVFHTSGGRTVYGGGGITPDLTFEPVTIDEFERKLERDAMFFAFAIDYSTDHEITEDFEVTDTMVEEFIVFLDGNEFEYVVEDFDEETTAYVKRGITREVISKNFGRKAMYARMLNYDEEFQQVLQIIKQSPTLQAMFDYAEEQNSMKKASLE